MADAVEKRSFWETLGFNLKKKEQAERTPSVTLDEHDDGAINMLNRVGSGAFGYTFSTDPSVFGSESELILRYRSMSQEHQLDSAIEDVINEFVSTDDNVLVTIDLDEIDGLSDASKKKISDEFQYILKLMSFNKRGWEIVKRWYIDGRMTYMLVLDPDSSKVTQQGIKEVKYIDPRKVKKVRVIGQDKSENGVVLSSVLDEYWMFNDNGFDSRKSSLSLSPLTTSTVGVKIAKDSIVQVNSGLMDPDNQMVLSYLHKAIRPFNQLRSIEDAEIVYFLVRAPNRRAFYIDVGDMTTAKAEQYVKGIMDRQKNKTVYDIATGKVNDDRRQMLMIDDYWLPRREGGKGTEIVPLEGGAQLQDMTAVLLQFQQNLYKALNIPITRLDPTQGLMLGRQAEISRDEVKFAKFISRLRRRFSELFIDLLERQLVIKGVLSMDEWQEMKDKITFEYASDNLFNEIKENEILTGRLDIAERILAGPLKTLYSLETINREILRRSEEEMNEENDKIKKETEKAQADGDDQINLGIENDTQFLKPINTGQDAPKKPPLTPKGK